MSYSIVIPFFRIIHFDGFRKVGESRFGPHKRLAHYDRRKKAVGKTVRSFFGEPNHYDQSGRCTGYSRKIGTGRLVHCDPRGRVVGFNRSLLGLIWLHWGRKASK